MLLKNKVRDKGPMNAFSTPSPSASWDPTPEGQKVPRQAHPFSLLAEQEKKEMTPGLLIQVVPFPFSFVPCHCSW